MRAFRLKHRIALGFVLLQLLLAGLGALSVAFVDRAAQGTAHLHRHAFVVVQSLAEIRSRVLDIKALLLQQMAFPAPAGRDQWRAAIALHRTMIEDNLAVIAAIPTDGNVELQAVKAAWEELRDFVEVAMPLAGQDAPASRRAFEGQGVWLFNRTAGTISDAMTASGARANEVAIGTEALRWTLRRDVVAVLCAALLLGGSLSVALSLAIVRPLARLRAAMRPLADGESAPPIPGIGRGDEIGDIARAFEQVRQEALDRQSSRLQFATIFQATPDIVTLSERDSGRYLDVNGGFETILGYRREEVLGKTSLELGIWATREHRAALVSALIRDGRLSNFPSQGRRRNGELFDALVSAEQFRVDGTDCMIFVARDVTQLKHREDLLRRSLAELERSNMELERFAHVAAHDLQEPCRTLCSFAQLLERSDGAVLSLAGREYLAFLTRGAVRMREQIQGLLAYSRVATSPTPFQVVPLDQVLDWVLKDLEPAVAERCAVIRRDPLPLVQGDPTQLRQLFGNLVGNSLKFQAAGQRAEIAVTASRQGSHWLLSVADNGIGIETQFLDDVFDAFRRLHGPERYPGSGLGLAVAKRIVERHGGTIWLTSAPGRGTTCHFTLPAAEAGGGLPPILPAT